jgi:tetratricopeptide (TPR) repeat protein
MKRIRTFTGSLIVAVAFFFVAGCETTDGVLIDTVEDSRHVIKIPEKIDQSEWRPEIGRGYYNDQSILYAELGSRFYAFGEIETAELYFRNALDFNPFNNKAHFSLGILAYEESRFVEALFHFQQIRREEKLAPYDIDYFQAAQMILGFFPFQAKVTAIDPNEYASEVPVVIINKGHNQGVREGMTFAVYRLGNEIRDIESLELIGRERTQIATATAVIVEPDNSVCRIENKAEGLYVRLHDVLETNYLPDVPEPAIESQPNPKLSLR